MPDIIDGKEMPKNTDFDLIEEIERNCNVAFTFDFDMEEMVVFSEAEKPIIFDFTDFSIVNIDKESFVSMYGGKYSTLPERYQKRLNKLRLLLGTDIVVIGDSWMRLFAIQVYNKYVIIGQIIIDMEGGGGGPDGDDGEPILVEEALDGASLFFVAIFSITV